MGNNTASITLALADGSGLIVHFDRANDQEFEAKVKDEINKFFVDRSRKKRFARK